MHRYTETRLLPYSPEALFDMVLDIEQYPKFLPWCRAARIVSREADAFLGELVISFSHLTERYTSRVTPVRPGAGIEGKIDVALVSGPFHYLNNHWRFVPHAQGCEIHLDLDLNSNRSCSIKCWAGFSGGPAIKWWAHLPPALKRSMANRTYSHLRRLK